MLTEKISKHYKSLLEKHSHSPALSKIVRISQNEKKILEDELEDPCGDAKDSVSGCRRLIHRYPDRALLLVTDRCASHCRFCFRRHKSSFISGDISEADIEAVAKYIIRKPQIRELILSGGDPMSLSNERLGKICSSIKSARSSISLRMHTRHPIYSPKRCARFAKLAGLFDTIVLHINHPDEISDEFVAALPELKPAKFLLNQSVLLKGVNDTPEILAELSKKLFDMGIMPVYLHCLDMAKGTSHFRVPLEKAVEIVWELQSKLPLFLVPRLILELPEGHGKIMLGIPLPQKDIRGDYIFDSPLNGKSVRVKAR